MGSGYLLDSKVIIDLMQNNLSIRLLDDLFSGEIKSSVITRIEVLGFQMDQSLELYFLNFFNQLTILPLTEEVVNQTILLRKQKKIKLGDAIIAATAIEHNLKLVTRNIRDFKGIENLALVDSGVS